MIYLLYGPDIVSARLFLVNFKKKYQDCLTLDASRQTASSLNFPKEDNLFGEKRLIIVENLIPKEDQPLEKITSVDILIWTKEIIKPPNWVDKSWFFKQTDFLSGFKLADYTTAGQKKEALITLKKLLNQKTPSELIIGSLVRQMKLISLALNNEEDKISKSISVINKTKNIAKNWTITKTKKALILILKSDWEIKNGLVNIDSGLTILVNQLCNLQRI